MLIQKFRSDVALSHLADLARQFYPELGKLAYVSDAVESALARNDFTELMDIEIDYAAPDLNVLEVIAARQVLALFQKYEDLPTKHDREGNAWEKFQSAENLCAQTNAIFRLVGRGEFNFSPRVNSVLYTASRKISLALGDVPSLSELEFQFGPGANTTVNARVSNSRGKLDATLACSSEMLSSASSFLEEFPGWMEARFPNDPSSDTWTVPIEVSPGRLTFVPKNAKTHRSISVEPILNSLAQKGIGKFLRSRLAFVGVDLKHGQQRNRDWARVASLDGRHATVDLSSASDTISKELVANLLPMDWFSFLSRFRTGKVQYGDKLITLEKFSSMGNAYTFELESLIFWALSTAVCATLQIDDKVAIYGDDIIIDARAVPLLEEVFRAVGFVFNRSKTFADGPFRESCGADWFMGFAVRPLYIKSLSYHALISAHNFFMRHFEFPKAAVIREKIPDHLKLFGPDGYGDGHLIGSWDPNPKRQKRLEGRGWSGYTFDTWVITPARNKQGTKAIRNTAYRELCLPGDRVLPAYTSYTREGTEDTPEQATDPLVIRGQSGYHRISIYTLVGGVFRQN
jgi:hypothetical protein